MAVVLALVSVLAACLEPEDDDRPENKTCHGDTAVEFRKSSSIITITITIIPTPLLVGEGGLLPKLEEPGSPPEATARWIRR